MATRGVLPAPQRMGRMLAALTLVLISATVVIGGFSALNSIRTPEITRQQGEDLDTYLQRAAELGVIPVWRAGG